MATRYDYTFMYMPSLIQMNPLEFEALNENEKAVAIGGQLEPMGKKLSDGLAALPQPGWEAVSHNQYFFGSTLITTFLIRRAVD